ncbi:ABC transporter substrate-binding protein [Actinomycetes bacterium]|nr:ABC transporter substrate-binding protein [Actinomycetes bacterium]
MNENIEQDSGFRAPIGRRKFLALSGGGIAAAILAACSKSDSATTDTTATAETTAPATDTGITGGGGADGTIKIGYVSPATGPLAAFASADAFIFEGIKTFLADGLRVGGKSYKVEILSEDSESDPTKAAAKAGKLITEDGIDLMLVGNTPDTTNPVADQCEANGVPCISSIAPWQAWFIGRGGKPGETTFNWTYHFFWGLEDIIPQFISMWSSLDTNKSIGGLFPNDGDGNVWGDTTVGFPPAVTAAGFTLTDPGRYENLNQDFTAQIAAFKKAKAEIITGVVIPPDFPTFWKQAKQQGFVPKAASIGKALLFPESIQALGKDGIGLSSEVWWSPNHPFSSSLTGASAKEVADAYTASSGAQWTQPIGFAHALFEVAIAALVAAGSTDKTAVRDAIKTMKLDTIVGTVDFTSGPIPNVAKTKLCGGQWREADTPTGYDLVIVDNSLNPGVPTGGTIEPITA